LHTNALKTGGKIYATKRPKSQDNQVNMREGAAALRRDG
jgi:hypothetical protein